MTAAFEILSEGGGESTFQRLVARAGCETDATGAYTCGDPGKAQQYMENKLMLDRELRQDFVNSLSQHIQDPHAFHRALLPMNIETQPTDSLLRVVVNVSAVQTQVGELLLQQLVEAGEEADPSSPLSAVPLLILGLFRWLDHVADPGALTKQALEVLGVCAEQVQREIIAFLPEIVVEEDQGAVVEALEELLQTETTFLVPALSTFSNLCMDAELQEHTTRRMLERFSAACVEDLPQLLRYLVQNSTGQVAQDVVQTLRSKLHFLSASDPRLPVTDRKQKGKMAAGGAATLEHRVLEGIRTGLQTAVRLGRRDCVTAFLSEFKAVDRVAGHRPLDLWLLAILHSFGGRDRTVVEAAFKSKVLDGSLEEGCITRAVVSHEDAVKQLFPSLMAMGAAFVRTGQREVSDAGGLLYKLLFCAFRDSYHQQEVLGALLASTGSSAVSEVTAALEVLVALAEGQTEDLLKFASFIGMLLDYLSNFTDEQLHLVFQLFSQLVVSSANSRAMAATSGGSRIEDELHIVITKQLSSADPRFKRIGIIGTVTHIRQLSAGCEELAPEVRAERHGEAIRMLSSMLAGCRQQPLCLCFLYDELSTMVADSSMPSFIAKWLSTRVVDPCLTLPDGGGGRSWAAGAALVSAPSDGITVDFENCFLLDNNADSLLPVKLPGLDRFTPEAALGLNSDEPNPVMLNLAALLGSTDQMMRDSLLHLAAQFRLMQLLEASENRSLGGIDALLSCPLTLPPVELRGGSVFWEASPAGREKVALIIFHAMNWLRELVNAFHSEDPPKVLRRLEDLMVLDRQMERCMEGVHANFSVPSLSDPLGIRSATPAAHQLPTKTKTAAPKRRKVGEKEHQAGSQMGSQASIGSAKVADGTQEDGGVKGGKRKRGATGGADDCSSARAAAKVAMVAVRAGMRPLQPVLLLLLHACLAPSPAATPAKGKTQLASALYLLEDLKCKLDVAFAKKRPAFLAASKPTGPTPSGLGLCSASPAALIPHLQPALPALRGIIDLASQAVRGEDAGEEMEEEGGGPEIAQRLFTLSLACVGIMLGHASLRTPKHQPFLRALLEAFDVGRGGKVGTSGARSHPTFTPLTAPVEAPWTRKQAETACSATFSYFLGHMCKEGGNFDDEMSAVRIMHAVLEVMQWADGAVSSGESSSGGGVAQMKRKLSLAAGGMLEEKWDHCPMIQGDFTAAPGWKGRNPQIGELVSMHVRFADNPVETIELLTTEHLMQVESGRGAVARRALESHPSLSSATLPIWYRVLHEELGREWDGVVAEALALQRSRTRADPLAVEALAQRSASAVKACSRLVQIVKLHESKLAVQAAAVKHAGRFIELFMKSLVFWEHHWNEHMERFTGMVKELQKGTRLLQVICCEGKSRKERVMVTKVPGLKRTLERFIFRMKAFFHGTDLVNNFWMGNLKHKNLRGEEVASQVEPEYSDEEEGEEEEGEGEEEDGPNSAEEANN